MIGGLATVTVTALVVEEIRSPRGEPTAASTSHEQVARGEGEGRSGVGAAGETIDAAPSLETPEAPSLEDPAVADEVVARGEPQRQTAKVATPPAGRVAGSPEAGPSSAESSAESEGEGASSDLGREARLLARAKEALNAGSPEQALEHLREHTRSFPEGSLREARSALRIESLCVLGRVREARGEAAALRRDYPDSSVARRLADPCVDS